MPDSLRALAKGINHVRDGGKTVGPSKPICESLAAEALTYRGSRLDNLHIRSFGAEFVGLVQVFIYIGAVAVLIVFTILLTRRDVVEDRGFNWGGVVVAITVFAGLVWAILWTPSLSLAAAQIEPLTVKRIGEVLMSDFVWPLQCVGLVLTAALIGALILVMEEKS